MFCPTLKILATSLVSGVIVLVQISEIISKINFSYPKDRNSTLELIRTVWMHFHCLHVNDTMKIYELKELSCPSGLLVRLICVMVGESSECGFESVVLVSLSKILYHICFSPPSKMGTCEDRLVIVEQHTSRGTAMVLEIIYAPDTDMRLSWAPCQFGGYVCYINTQLLLESIQVHRPLIIKLGMFSYINH